MLKIKKLKPEQLDTLVFNDYKKLVRPLLVGTSKLHKSAAEAVEFFLITDFEFADKPGKKTMIFVPGKQTTEWKKYLKIKFKEDKKNLMIGSCFVNDIDSKQLLNLIPIKGSAKMAKIKKQGKRMFSMAKLIVGLASGAEEITEASGGVANSGNLTGRTDDDDDDDDNMEEDVEEVLTAAEQAANSGKTIVEQLKDQLKELATQISRIKNGIPAIKEAAAKLQNKTATEEDADRVEVVLDDMEIFVEDFEEAHPKVQARIASAKNKVTAQIPQIQRLLDKIQELIPQSLDDFEEDEEDDDLVDEDTAIEEPDLTKDIEEASSEEVNTPLSAAEIAQLRVTMNTARTEIIKLMQELDLDELLKEVA